MKSPVAAGRTIGVLLLLQLAAGLMAPYMMLRPLGDLFTYNANDPAKSFQVRLSVMLLFLGAVIVLAISFTAGPALRERGRVIGLWVIALAVVNFSLQCVENAAWMSMFNFSQVCESGRNEPCHVSDSRRISALVLEMGALHTSAVHGNLDVRVVSRVLARRVDTKCAGGLWYVGDSHANHRYHAAAIHSVSDAVDECHGFASGLRLRRDRRVVDRERFP
jgi:hypothetical protein